jgi:adenosylcobinamide-GDP ribazoletransferase
MGTALKAAFGFLSVIGRRGAVPSTRTSRWFPLVGLVLGALVGAVWWGAGNLWPALLAAMVAVAADLALTGMLHLDGLADSADGLLPHMDPARRLEVMRAPDVGAFGIGVVVVVLLLRVAALASIGSLRWHGVALLAALWCASRTAMAAAMWLVPNARPDGSLAQIFGRSPGAMWGAPVALVLSSLADPWRLRGPLAVLVGWLVIVGLCALARRRIGGITGDILGASGILAETTALLVFAAHL